LKKEGGGVGEIINLFKIIWGGIYMYEKYREKGELDL
jgi:hypothetical protein